MNRLPRLALSLSALLASGGFSIEAARAGLEVTYNGYIYSLDSAYRGEPVIGDKDTAIKTSSWYNKVDLARGLSAATALQLGSYNWRGGELIAPYFYCYFESGAPNNALKSSFCQYMFNRDYNYSTTNCPNDVTRDLNEEMVLGYAYEASPRRPVPVALPIGAAGNVLGGSGNNVTSNLGSKLLPQFEGGTLSVSASAVNIADNFTVDSSSANRIDAVGNSATFSGVSSDAIGTTGQIAFGNSSANRATLLLSGQSTYSGSTYIDDNATLQIGVDNALPQRGLVALSGSGSLDLNGKNQAIGALDGNGFVSLGTGTLTIQGGAAQLSNSGAAISGTGGLTKSGDFTQVFSGAHTYSGPTQISGGSLILNGTSTSAMNVAVGATLGGSGAISANVVNSGTLSPGNSIGTLTIANGTYTQTTSGVLFLEVDGATSDLLKLTGSGSVTDLAGTVKISGNPTPGLVYTGIEGPTAYSGKSAANADTSSVVIASAYKFCREDDVCFRYLNGSPSVDKTKLQFGWAPSVAILRSGPAYSHGHGRANACSCVDQDRRNLDAWL